MKYGLIMDETNESRCEKTYTSDTVSERFVSKQGGYFNNNSNSESNNNSNSESNNNSNSDGNSGSYSGNNCDTNNKGNANSHSHHNCNCSKSNFIGEPSKFYKKSITVEHSSDNEHSFGKNKYKDYSKQSTLNIDNKDNENVTDHSSEFNDFCIQKERKGYNSSFKKTCKGYSEQICEVVSNTDDFSNEKPSNRNEVVTSQMNENDIFTPCKEKRDISIYKMNGRNLNIRVTKESVIKETGTNQNEKTECEMPKCEKNMDEEGEENSIKNEENDSILYEGNEKNSQNISKIYRDTLGNNLDINWNKSQIKTCIRIKPLDTVGNPSENVVTQKGQNKILINYGMQSENKKCEFLVDRIFNEGSTQSDIWRSICFCIDSIFYFKNATIFAHGHTGTGKTYTMIGPDVMELIKKKKKKTRYFAKRIQPIELLINTNSLKILNNSSNSNSNNFLYDRKRSCSQPIFNFPPRMIPLANGNYSNYKKMYDVPNNTACSGPYNSANNSSISTPNCSHNPRYYHKSNMECISENNYGKYEIYKNFSEYQSEYKPNMKSLKDEIRLIMNSEKKGMIPRACEEIMNRLSLMKAFRSGVEVCRDERERMDSENRSDSQSYDRGDVQNGARDIPAGKTKRQENCLDELREKNKKRKDVFKSVKVYASYMQLYNDRIFDLLNPYTEPQLYLSTKKSKFSNNTTSVSGLLTVEVTSCEELIELLIDGTSNRACRITKTNEMSTRSHSIFKIELRYMNSSKPECFKSGNLLLIDLAGNEKYAASNEKLYTTEVCSINRSLSALSLCINELSKGNKNISYRNSILTRLLQDSLGGSSKTVFICTISACMRNARDTLSSLKLVSKAKKIQIENRCNKTLVYEEDIRKLKKELHFLKKFVFFQYITNKYESRKRLKKIKEFYIANSALAKEESIFHRPSVGSYGGTVGIDSGSGDSTVDRSSACSRSSNGEILEDKEMCDKWRNRKGIKEEIDIPEEGRMVGEELNEVDSNEYRNNAIGANGCVDNSAENKEANENEYHSMYEGIENIYNDYELTSFNSLLYQWNLNKSSIKKVKEKLLKNLNNKKNFWFHFNGNINKKSIMNFIETHTIEYEIESDGELYNESSDSHENVVMGEYEEEEIEEGENCIEEVGDYNENDFDNNSNYDGSKNKDQQGNANYDNVDGEENEISSSYEDVTCTREQTLQENNARSNEDNIKDEKKGVEIFRPHDYGDNKCIILDGKCRNILKERGNISDDHEGYVVKRGVMEKEGRNHCIMNKGENSEKRENEDPNINLEKVKDTIYAEDVISYKTMKKCNSKKLNCTPEVTNAIFVQNYNSENVEKSQSNKKNGTSVLGKFAGSTENTQYMDMIPRDKNLRGEMRKEGNLQRGGVNEGINSFFCNLSMSINKRKGTSRICKNKSHEQGVMNVTEQKRRKKKVIKCIKTEKERNIYNTWNRNGGCKNNVEKTSLFSNGRGTYRKKKYAELHKFSKCTHLLDVNYGTDLTSSDNATYRSSFKKGLVNGIGKKMSEVWKGTKENIMTSHAEINGKDSKRMEDPTEKGDGWRREKKDLSDGFQMKKTLCSNSMNYKLGHRSDEQNNLYNLPNLQYLLELSNLNKKHNFVNNVGINNMVINKVNIFPNSKEEKIYGGNVCEMKNKDLFVLRDDIASGKIKTNGSVPVAVSVPGNYIERDNLTGEKKEHRGRSVSENCCLSNWKNKTIIGQNSKGKFAYYIEFDKINDVKKYITDGNITTNMRKGNNNDLKIHSEEHVEDIYRGVKNRVDSFDKKKKKRKNHLIAQIEESWLNFEKKLETKLIGRKEMKKDAQGGESDSSKRKAIQACDRSKLSALDENKKKLDILKSRYEKILVSKSQKRDSKDVSLLCHSVGGFDTKNSIAGYNSSSCNGLGTTRGAAFSESGISTIPSAHNIRAFKNIEFQSPKKKKSDVYRGYENVIQHNMSNNPVSFEEEITSWRKKGFTHDNNNTVKKKHDLSRTIVGGADNFQEFIRMSDPERGKRFFVHNNLNGTYTGMGNKKWYKSEIVNKLTNSKIEEREDSQMEKLKLEITKGKKVHKTNTVGKVYVLNSTDLCRGENNSTGAENLRKNMNLNENLIFTREYNARDDCTYVNNRSNVDGSDKITKKWNYHMVNRNGLGTRNNSKNVQLERKTSSSGISNCVLLSTQGNFQNWEGYTSGGVVSKREDTLCRDIAARRRMQIGKNKPKIEILNMNKYGGKYMEEENVQNGYVHEKENNSSDVCYYKSRKMHKMDFFHPNAGSIYDNYENPENVKMRNCNYTNCHRIYHNNKINYGNSVIPYSKKTKMNESIKNIHSYSNDFHSDKLIVKNGIIYGEKINKVQDVLPTHGSGHKDKVEMYFHDFNTNEFRQLKLIHGNAMKCDRPIYKASTFK
ncbi:kinesin-19 [Plasmodium gonderi]|uniref:Kinesin-19 n=1 Tax=Plasmodium gonderi TaxID=77519 RepID=A0A1Y1JCI3_PLAGO|nr:kinesin-19 [Plasmodium gonderi]GAW79388.1 kinesin-19 [Plasmodium gonderi]